MKCRYPKGPYRPHNSTFLNLSAIVIVLFPACLLGQITATGALSGSVFDPSGAALPGVAIRLTDRDTSETHLTHSDERGRFEFLALSPGLYSLRAIMSHFQDLVDSDLDVSVTETLHIELHMQLAARIEHTMVLSEPAMVQTDTSALGRVVNETALIGLPLVTRNFAQVAVLSLGVVVGVSNAGELGLGGIALSQIERGQPAIALQQAGRIPIVYLHLSGQDRTPGELLSFIPAVLIVAAARPPQTI